jgi:hypothetical protein
MAYNVKYDIAYRNISGESFLLEILKEGEFSEELALAGNVIHNFTRVEDVFNPLRASTLDINIEASTENLLLDFANFEEFDFKVRFYRNSQQIFEGWINPDGYFQDWVNSKWVISLQAVDGIGALKNLEFSDIVQNQDVPFKVNPREANYLYAIMERLGYILPFTIGDDINNDLGVANDWTDFKKRILDPDVFRNQNGNFLDCETVLKDLLAKYNLCISQANIDGRLCWYIRRVYYGTLPASQRRNRQYNNSFDINKTTTPQDTASYNQQLGTDGGEPANVLYLFRGTSGGIFTAEMVGQYMYITGSNEGLYKITNVINDLSVRLVKLEGDATFGGVETINIFISEGVEVVFSQFAFADGIPANKLIGSDINSQTQKQNAIHCNENQQITFDPALQNFRFESKWLGLRNFFGTIEEDYELIQTDFPAFYFKENNRLFLRTTFGFVDDLIFESEEYEAPTNSNLNPIITFRFESYFEDGGIFQNADRLRFMWGVLWTDDNNDEFWYNVSTGEWQTSQITNIQNSGFANQQFIPGRIDNELIVELSPISSGNIVLYIAAPYNVANAESKLWIEVYDTAVTFSDPLLGIGKTHDAIQPTKRSTFLDKPVNVINSNEPNAIFTNNLYRIASAPEIITGLVPMTQWKATGTPTYPDLLELTSRERIRLKNKPQRVFKGDIFGFVPYHSVINYDGIPGNYHPTQYSHDTAANIIELECKQMFNDDVLIDHEKNYIFENERNVLIKEL